MGYYVYMLKSKGTNSVTYVGYTKNIKMLYEKMKYQARAENKSKTTKTGIA